MIYDHEANILSIEIANGHIDQAREFGNFIIHFSKSGKPILIEIIEASKFVGKVEKLKNVKDIKKLMLAN